MVLWYELLLANNAAVNIKGRGGQTTLNLAMQRGYTQNGLYLPISRRYEEQGILKYNMVGNVNL